MKKAVKNAPIVDTPNVKVIEATLTKPWYDYKTAKLYQDFITEKETKFIKELIMEKEEQLKQATLQLFQRFPEFKKWIESTSLFNAIINDASRRALLILHNPDGTVRGTFSLSGAVVTKAEELPFEMIEDFYINSPFFGSSIDINDTYRALKIKLLENEHREDQDKTFIP